MRKAEMTVAAATDVEGDGAGAPAPGSHMAIEPATAFPATDILAGDAWTLLRDDPRALLVDVRTAEERELFGQPDLSAIAKTPLFIAW